MLHVLVGLCAGAPENPVICLFNFVVVMQCLSGCLILSVIHSNGSIGLFHVKFDCFERCTIFDEADMAFALKICVLR